MNNNQVHWTLMAIATAGLLAGCQESSAIAPNPSDPEAVARMLASSVAQTSRNSDVDSITANSVYDASYAPRFAFDGMPAGNWTQWISGHEFRPFVKPAIIQVKYSTPKTVLGYTLMGRYESLKDRLPKNWRLQGSNATTASVDDSLASPAWTTLDAAENQFLGEQWNSKTSSARLTRLIVHPLSFTKYRLCVTAVNGSSVVDLIEIELLTAANPVVAITANSVYGPSYDPKFAFDGMPPGNWTQWISDHDFRPFSRAATIQIEYSQPRTVSSYTLVGRYESLKDRLPKNWLIQGSNAKSASVDDPATDEAWTTLDQAVDQTLGDEWASITSSAKLTRTIPRPASYTKYRMCVTAVNGSSVVDLIEIEFTE